MFVTLVILFEQTYFGNKYRLRLTRKKKATLSSGETLKFYSLPFRHFFLNNPLINWIKISNKRSKIAYLWFLDEIRFIWSSETWDFVRTAGAAFTKKTRDYFQSVVLDLCSGQVKIIILGYLWVSLWQWSKHA